MVGNSSFVVAVKKLFQITLDLGLAQMLVVYRVGWQALRWTLRASQDLEST